MAQWRVKGAGNKVCWVGEGKREVSIVFRGLYKNA